MFDYELWFMRHLVATFRGDRNENIHMNVKVSFYTAVLMILAACTFSATAMATTKGSSTGYISSIATLITPASMGCGNRAWWQVWYDCEEA